MHQHSRVEIDFKGKPRIALVGNPNVGKSVVFELLTGKYVTVSNYPGTTVEVTQGTSNFDRKEAVVLDTPGINNLIPRSEDERVTRDILLEERPKVVVHVADSKNLARNLQVTLQLIEMGLPLVLDLNMWDEAVQKNIRIDSAKLTELLGIDVVETVATEKRGMGKLIHAVSSPRVSTLRIDYGEIIENAINSLERILPDTTISKRAQAIMLLCGDETFKKLLIYKGIRDEVVNEIGRIKIQTQKAFGRPLSYVINRKRWEKIRGIVREVVSESPGGTSPVFKERLGKWMMSPVWGFPILIMVLFVVYKFVGQFGAGTSVDFLENKVWGSAEGPTGGFDIAFRIPFSNAWHTITHINFQGINWYLKAMVDKFGIPILIEEFLIGKYGLITMGLTYSTAIVLPIVSFFFIAFGILEDSGYLPRLTVMANRIFKRIGLNGKAALPMVLGLGCDTMATLTTRTLDTKKERIIATLILALGIPCSAQLGVVLGMLGSISLKALLVTFGVVLFQILLVGFLASKIIRGEPSDFIIEIPPIRIPKVSNVFIKTVARLEWFLKEAVPLFLLGTLMLFIVDKTGLLKVLERLCSPVITGLLSLPQEATWTFIVGFLRRDYGAAGLYQMQQAGLLTATQIVVSMVVITLFVPCLANFFVIIKEHGLKKALYMAGFIFPFAILVGGILNLFLKMMNVQF